MTKVKVYQADIGVRYKYCSYANAMSSLKREDYKLVYDGEIDLSGNVDNVAEYLFVLLNKEDLPDGYKGHSLSVSDIVVIEGQVLYCDTFGWRHLANDQWD